MCTATTIPRRTPSRIDTRLRCLSVEDLSEAGGPFLGVEDCSFLHPVYPGDTLTAESTVIDARVSESRPNTGIVSWHTEGRNQDGQPVVDYRRTNLVAKERKQPMHA